MRNWKTFDFVRDMESEKHKGKFALQRNQIPSLVQGHFVKQEKLTASSQNTDHKEDPR
jgi:hypothetical protein